MTDTVVRIKVVWGKSEGETLVSAFDKALMQAGIHNLNLIPLSSVIPAGTIVDTVGNYKSFYDIGDICYIVLSSFNSNKPKTQISAGLGWIETDKGGLFFESKGEYSPTYCRDEIKRGLRDMMSARGWDGVIKTKVVTHKVKMIASVIVAAVYEFYGDKHPVRRQLIKELTKY